VGKLVLGCIGGAVGSCAKIDAPVSRQVAASGHRLTRLMGVAGQLGAARVARDAAELLERVDEGRFFVACVGQFKRGKSTLLNALVGEPVLPTGVVPVTSAITLLRYGSRGARVRFDDGREERVPIETLAEFVTEEANPENRKRVRAVEVSLPSPLLSHGMCLVDTPGLGSASEGNAAVTREFVPHVDAALVVIGADPPVSGEEVALVEAVARNVRHLIVVLNKADRITARERDEGVRFAEQVLAARLHRPVGRIYEASAHERLATGAATRDWAKLSRTLEALAGTEGADLVQAAEARGAARLARELLAEISDRRDALTRPVQESQRRLELLSEHVAGAERALQDLGVLLGAEQARLSGAFRERQERFLPSAQDAARADLRARVGMLSVPKHRLRSAFFDQARDISSALSERFRSELEPEAEGLYRAAMERFVVLANEFLTRVAREPGMTALQPVDADTGFRVRGDLRYTDLLYTTTATPLAWAADVLRPRRMVAAAVLRRAGAYLDRLVETNSSRIANDLVERAAASRARLEGEIRGRLQEIRSRTRRALDQAQQVLREGQPAIEAELARLDALRRETESLVAAPLKGEGS
jgi:GTP-binding protein EngB required for normal cell division